VALLREKLIHAGSGDLREQGRDALITPQGNGSTNEIFDGRSTFGFHPPPRSVSYACFGCCRLLGKIKG
jgi:hypothetical protein